MLCVVTENGWSNIIYNYAKKFDSFALSALFFNSFYLLVKFIILSLLTGLIWEIFTIISSNYNQNEEKNKKGSESSGGNSNADLPNNDQQSEDVVFVSPQNANHQPELSAAQLLQKPDEKIVFFREKLVEVEENKIIIQQEMVRDDYSFDKENNEIDEKSVKLEDISAKQYYRLTAELLK